MTKSQKAACLRRLGERLRHVRIKNKLSLNETAKEAGLSAGNLSEIESGRRDPRYCTLRSIADTVGLPISKLLRDL